MPAIVPKRYSQGLTDSSKEAEKTSPNQARRNRCPIKKSTIIQLHRLDPSKKWGGLIKGMKGEVTKLEFLGDRVLSQQFLLPQLPR